jgi:hypothetical protein
VQALDSLLESYKVGTSAAEAASLCSAALRAQRPRKISGLAVKGGTHRHPRSLSRWPGAIASRMHRDFKALGRLGVDWREMMWTVAPNQEHPWK